ncbi:MAG: hypothetical protein IJU23_07725, partial [Proteobacteria bacterium]|nr:hypothetical protein [Pseudomonadota bacterium]
VASESMSARRSRAILIKKLLNTLDLTHGIYGVHVLVDIHHPPALPGAINIKRLWRFIMTEK